MDRPDIVGSVWAESAITEATLRSWLSSHATGNAAPTFDEWIHVAQGANFGCPPIERLHAYRSCLEVEGADPRVIPALAGVSASGMKLLERLTRRVTPMTIEQATDVAGMDAIDQLLSSGLVVQSQNKKGMPVIQDDFELRAAIRIEFARRARLWRLIVSYARSDRYVVQNCSTAPEMARLLKGYRGVSRPGACSVCADDGRKVYPIGELPPIPHMNCTCDDGCQCIVIPILVSGRGLQ